MNKFEDKLVEVCANCLQASCWYGELLCDKAATCGTVLKTVTELRSINRAYDESEYYWSDEYMEKIYGNKSPYGYAK